MAEKKSLECCEATAVSPDQNPIKEKTESHSQEKSPTKPERTGPK